MNNEVYFTMGIIGLSWILVVLATAFVPFYIRKSIAFGVSIPETEYHSAFFTKLRRHYLVFCLVFGSVLGIGSSLSFIWVKVRTATWIHLFTMVVYLVLTSALYVLFYRRVRTYKQNADWPVQKTAAAVLTSDKNEKKPLSPFWFLTYLAVIAGTVMAVIIKYPSLPDKIPMHFNMAGQADRYAAKSISAFLLLPIIQLLIGLLFFGINLAILRAKRQGGTGDIESGLKKGRAFQAIMSKALFSIGLMVMLLFGTIQLSMLQILNQQITIVAPVAFLIAISGIIIYLAAKVGQGGSRIKGGRNEASTVVEDDSRWILGVFYFNKSDPSVMVEKRFGLGYTINFGNPKSWIAIVAFVVLIAAMIVLPLLVQ